MDSNTVSIVVCSVLAIIILLLILAMWYFFHVGLPKHLPNSRPNGENCEKAILRREFKKSGVLTDSKKVIQLEECLGTGEFGAVVAGILFVRDDTGTRETSTPVAIKIPRTGWAEAESGLKLLREAKRQLKLTHPHILKLLAVCTEPSPMLITERLTINLFQYLLLVKSGKKPSVEIRQMIRILRQVAQGAAFMHDADYTHRDIAARNVLLTADQIDKADAKLADFGLSRHLYHGSYYRLNNYVLPLAWLAPEALQSATSCPKGDSWSFAVLIWEMLMEGETPRGGQTAEQVIQDITSPDPLRRYLPRPPVLSSQFSCVSALWNIMTRCWALTPLERPKMTEIDESLSDIATRIGGIRKFSDNPLYTHSPVEMAELSSSALAPAYAALHSPSGSKDSGIPSGPDYHFVLDHPQNLLANPSSAYENLGCVFTKDEFSNNVGPYFHKF